MKFKLLIVIALLCGWNAARACTNFICSRGASTDGSTFITYAADSHTRYGQLRYHRGGDTLYRELTVCKGTPFS